jgi:hypothetical protein
MWRTNKSTDKDGKLIGAFLELFIGNMEKMEYNIIKITFKISVQMSKL